MKRRLPPLNALRAFEAAARHLSFNRAADELSVTPAAVSQQIRLLEAWLGTPLFRRQRRGVLLTDAGQIYWPALRELFDRLELVTRQVVDISAPDVLLISTTASFAARWLIPRLGRLGAVMPDVEVRVMASTALADFARDGVDVAIRYGRGAYPGLRSDFLMPGATFAVCSPALAADPARPLRAPADLVHHTLLHDEFDVSGDLPEMNWAAWLKAAGVDGVDAARGPRFSYSHMCLEAAAAGYGVALATAGIAFDDIATGHLVRPFPQVVTTPYDYFVVYPETAAARPQVAAFRDWALEEAAAARWATADQPAGAADA